jgi:hypothetical protein
MYEVLTQVQYLIAQETLNPKVLDLVGQGIISIAILVIWFYTFKQSSKQQEEANNRYALLATENSNLIKQLFDLVKGDTKYKELIAGILGRLELNIQSNNRLIEKK